MPSITYIHLDGRRDVVDVANGTNVMRAAVMNGIDGIIGECGGSAMCATCHVYVDDTFLGALPARSPSEDEMLTCTASPRMPNSRLGCQLRMSAELPVLVVTIPDLQL